VRKRRNESRGLAAGAASLAASLCLRLWAKAARRPVDFFAILAAVAASVVIVVNAVALQSGARPAPFVVNAPPPRASSASLKSAEPQPIHATEAPRTTRAIAASRNDPIAQLIDTSSRIAAIQRALSDYGYGQIKASGFVDAPTSAAIEKFERQHQMPVTGRISERLVNDLAAMVGHPLD
jgi:hypothetical protein